MRFGKKGGGVFVDCGARKIEEEDVKSHGMCPAVVYQNESIFGRQFV